MSLWGEHLILFLSSRYLDVRLLGHMVDIYLYVSIKLYPLYLTLYLFSIVPILFWIPISNI